MQKSRRTKETYLLESLRLFAERSYDGVGVVDLAKAVGVSPSALYKHFPNKRALYVSILDWIRDEFLKSMQRLQMDFAVQAEKENPVSIMSVEEQVAMMKRLFLMMAEGEQLRLFRKLVTVEQFHQQEMVKLYEEHYLWNQKRSFEYMMRAWIEQGFFHDGDAEMMAVQYLSPVLVLISAYDRDTSRLDRLLTLLETHIRQFNRAYQLRPQG